MGAVVKALRELLGTSPVLKFVDGFHMPQMGHFSIARQCVGFKIQSLSQSNAGRVLTTQI